MDLFLDRLITHTGHDWVAQCVTLYADDIHVGCSFESEGALRTAVTNMGHLLDILEDLCMTISCEKSFLLLTVAGTNPRLYMKPYIRRGSHGTTFEIPRSTGQTTSIPMKSSGRYLGAIMSYRMMEELTWKHRCKSAWLAFNRLKKWLQSRQLSVRYKMHLWQSCVHTILTYGILDMNSTVKTLHQYQQTVYTMIRMVIGDHSYRTHHTHQQAFQAHHIELPLPMLGRLAMNMLRRLNRREDTIASDDIVLTIPWTHLTETLRLIDAIHDTSAQVPIAVDQHQPVSTQAQQCPCCPFVTDSIPNLRRHLTVTTAQPRHWWPTAMDRVDIEDREPYITLYPLRPRLPTGPQLPCGLDSDGCMHCGEIFMSRSGLRRHITEGRCMSFDPLTSPQPLNAADRWSSLHAAGQFTAPVLTAIHRIKLTLTCQFCGTRYQRQGDLVAHLLQSHPALWNNSQETLRFLLQTVIAHTGCLCNPQVHQTNRTHVCTVVRQLAMAFHQSELEVLVPTVYSPQLLDAMLVNLGNTEQIQRLRVLLHDRQFSSLWQDLDVLILLRSRSCCCQSMDYGAWDSHDQALMDSLQALAPMFLGTRKQELANDDRTTKRHKGPKQEEHGDQRQVQVLTQVVTKMAQLLLNHERSLQTLHHQDSYVIFARTHPIGMMPIMATLAQEWKTKAPQNQENPQWLTLRSHLLRGLLQELLTRVVQLQESQPGQQLWDTAVAKQTILQDGSWVYMKWSPSDQQLIPTKRTPIPMGQMVKLLKVLIAALQDNMHVLRFQSLRTQQEVTLRDSELWATFNELTGNSVWGLMAMSLKRHQQVYSKPAQQLADLLGKGKGRGKGKQVLTMLALQNPGSLCYANSATLCYWWSCLSRVNFQYQDWGSQSATFLNLLQRDNNIMISLDEYEWFNQLIASWQDPDSQADSAEFTHRLLTWVGTPIVSNRWERRVHTSERTELHDSGDTYMPITLQLDMDMIADNEVSLESLVRLWHGELGMSAGLTDPSDLVVLHIDRLFHNDTGRLQKLHTVIRFCWLVQIPILQHDMPVRWEPYQLVAAFAHIGEAQGGHYQALLKTFPETTDLANPTMWLFCDDGREPQPRWTIPPQFEEGVTCFWLCRCNQVELHRLPSQVPVRQTTTDEALIALLADPQTSRNGQLVINLHAPSCPSWLIPGPLFTPLGNPRELPQRSGPEKMSKKKKRALQNGPHAVASSHLISSVSP
ncbi:unnamed protein product [Cladocopium goreaui]|uniref:LINE-1 retrotransposable element ORF2 protein n=1 Tax=Cladocopium goreaui TaxID=2562237 RepID=A0A9P1CJ60_9DINO|nr:unnamed protein product [Cladocopium goreaui]